MSDNIINDFGKLLRQKRKDYNLTQEALADLTGISRKHIANIEKGIANGSFEMIAILAKRLNISIDKIIFDNYDEVEQLNVDVIANLADCTKDQQEFAISILNTMVKEFKKMNNH